MEPVDGSELDLAPYLEINGLDQKIERRVPHLPMVRLDHELPQIAIHFAWQKRECALKHPNFEHPPEALNAVAGMRNLMQAVVATLIWASMVWSRHALLLRK